MTALSGATYVVAIDRTDPEHKFQLRIVSPRNCEGVETICDGEHHNMKCVDSWLIDWDLRFKRTQGGRLLAQRTGKVINV